MAYTPPQLLHINRPVYMDGTNDRGLYVSTEGFTREARYEAERSNVPMRLLDLDGFVRHYVDVYDKTDEETRDILPLTRIWWPA